MYLMFFINFKKKFLKKKLASLNLKLYTSDFRFFCFIEFWSLFYGLFMTLKVFRVIFFLPVNGQKTWSPLYSLRKYNNYIYNYKWFYFKKHFPKTKKNYFLTEYFNLFFQACFYNQWRFNKKKLRSRSFKKRILDTKSIHKVNYINMYRSKYAVVLGKKKNKTSFQRNLGLKLGFSKKFKNRLII